MSNSDRRQLVIERILEDEHLRGDLEDAAARELLGWATTRASVIACPANLPMQTCRRRCARCARPRCRPPA
ncbi:MAG: hypothetical protein U0Z44_11180 [Kouleothrix sp.]